jgi:hypothetical protein
MARCSRMIRIRMIAVVDSNSHLSDGHQHADISRKSLLVPRSVPPLYMHERKGVAVVDALIQPEQDSKARQNQSNHDIGPYSDTVQSVQAVSPVKK